MPEFVLDTAGRVVTDLSEAVETYFEWCDLDTFTQGYIEALFFTEQENLMLEGCGNGSKLADDDEPAFSDLAPETLAAILTDCAKFQDSRAWADVLEGFEGCDESQGGQDFWLTRNGHGCGFWDGDWPEPHGDALDQAAKAFGQVDAYLGDDGKVYL